MELAGKYMNKPAVPRLTELYLGDLAERTTRE